MLKTLFTLTLLIAAFIPHQPTQAQSAFQGGFVDLATGYEKNSVSGIRGNLINSTTPSNSLVTAPNARAEGELATLGFGYNFSMTPKWLLGLGLNYSPLSQKTNRYRYTATLTGYELYDADLDISNRIEIYLAPSFVIDQEKLIYLKFGYSTVRMKALSPARASDGPHNGFTSDPSEFVNGTLLGIGYKQTIQNGFYGFVEGNYSNFDRRPLTATGLNDASPAQALTLTVNPKLTTQQLRLGVGYQFR